MSFPSKFNGKCKDCGIANKAGENIAKNGNGNWCKDGMNCQGAIQTTESSKSTQETNGYKKVEGKSNIQMITDEFIAFVKSENFILDKIEKIVLEEIAAQSNNTNPQKIGMRVKEIYKTHCRRLETGKI